MKALNDIDTCSEIVEIKFLLLKENLKKQVLNLIQIKTYDNLHFSYKNMQSHLVLNGYLLDIQRFHDKNQNE